MHSYLSRVGKTLYCTSLVNTHSVAHEIHACKLEKIQEMRTLLHGWFYDFYNVPLASFDKSLEQSVCSAN